MSTHPTAFLASQRRALLALRQQVSERLRIPAKLQKEDGRDLGDLSVADEQASFDFTLNEMTYDMMREIDQALHRIKVGTYGICEQTQELIPMARLKALPFARMTVVAQGNLERGFDMRRRKEVGLAFDELPEEASSVE
jgi:DnaK suppressor protein